MECSIMEHACDLAERIGNLLFHDRSSDVTLIVEGEPLPAHKAILGISSEYFRALLLGAMRESSQGEVVLEGVPLRPFKLLMNYVYTGQLNLKEMDLRIILEILELAHCYRFEKLEVALCRHLHESLSIDNVCAIYDIANRLPLKKLHEVCRDIMDRDPSTVLKSEWICDLSENALCSIVSEDTFCAKEIEIFEAVARWCAKHPAENGRSRVLGAIRLPLIDSKDLLTTVMESGLIARDAIFSAIQARECRAADLNFRASLYSGVNLADPDLGAYRLEGSRGGFVTEITDPVYRKDFLPRYPSNITLNLAVGLTVALKQSYFINRVAFWILSRSRYAYYIEVSVDLEHWIRVIDYRNYGCRSFQNLYFEKRAAQFVRVVGLKNEDIDLSALKVNHVSEPFKLVHEVYVPENNVATKALGTWFGTERKKQNSEEKEFIPTGSSELMWHEIGNGCIRIEFPQPYSVGSMQMFLKYTSKYYIETSTDSKNWRRVADHTVLFCRGWQRITFDVHPVLFIRIVGTASSDDKDFSCSSFECPASVKADAQSSDLEDLTGSNPSGTD